MKQNVVKIFITETADQLLDHKMYKLAESKNFAEGVTDKLMKSSIVTVPVACVVKQQVEKAIASKTKFRQHVSLEQPAEDKITPRLPLMACSPESSKTYKDDEKDR